jgi:hypothetical protein
MLKIGEEFKQLLKNELARSIVTATSSHTTISTDYEQVTLTEKHRVGNKLIVSSGKIKINEEISFVKASAVTFFGNANDSENFALRITKNGSAEITVWSRAPGNNVLLSIPPIIIPVNKNDTIEVDVRSSSTSGRTISNFHMTVETVE